MRLTFQTPYAVYGILDIAENGGSANNKYDTTNNTGHEAFTRIMCFSDHVLDLSRCVISDEPINLAKNFTTSNSAVSAWLSSPTHRANVLKQDYQDVGFAVLDGQLNGQPTTLIVALYAAPENPTVQGSMAHTASSNMDAPLSFMSRLGLGIQAMTPAAISSIVLLLIAANVALAAHLYRRRLPLGLRRSWYRHHGAYKAGIFTCIAIVIVFAYGGVGQI